MIIFPAIDLQDGRVVRLTKGDFLTTEVFSNDPVKIAKEYEKQGAEWLHLIDLDGAKTGANKNIQVIQKITQSTLMKVQVGGGIRSVETIIHMLDLGVDRVIVGTMAVRDIDLIAELVTLYPGRIIVSVDSKNGFVTDSGWQETSKRTTLSFCQQLEAVGIKTIVYTDIDKDGMMEGPNFTDYKTLTDNTSLQVIASGGVSTLDDVKALNEMDLYGAIIGKALYLKAIDLKEAIRCSQDESSPA